jgi:hypothetical protein
MVFGGWLNQADFGMIRAPLFWGNVVSLQRDK